MNFLDIKALVSLKNKVACKVKDLSQTFYDEEGLVDSDKKRQYINISNNVFNCHKFVEMAICENDGARHFSRTMCCDFRFCPICARKRYLKYLSFLYPIFEKLVNEGKYVCMLNLTIKNTKTLKEGREKIFDAWRELTHDNRLSARLFKFHITGGLKSFEATYNMEDKTWHPHFHILIVKEKYSRDFELIKTLWEQACQKVFNTTEKVGSIYIEGIKDKHNKNIGYMKDKSSILNGILECIKYVTKLCVKDKDGKSKSIFEVYENYQLIELIDDLKGTRVLSTFGCLFGYQKQLSAIKSNWDDYKLKKQVCKVCGCTEFYYETELITKIDNLLMFD